MKVLIVGASSYIGFHLFKHLNKKYNCIGTYFTNKRSEKLIHLNILSKEELENTFSKHKPDVILWISGAKDVKICEQDERYAYSINTQPIIDYVNILDKQKFIFISTNYVFDGVTGNYKDCDKPAPLTIYGKTNYLAEQTLLKSNKNFNIIRSSAVIGKGSIFYEWLKDNLKSNSQISLFDSYFTPTPIQLLIDGIDFMINTDKYKNIFHICGELKITRYDLGKTIQQLIYNNKSEIIKINSTDSFLHQDLSLIQSKICSSFQTLTFLEYVKRELLLND
jgi:dTDP-4-dehydrorhamnose reductase